MEINKLKKIGFLLLAFLLLLVSCNNNIINSNEVVLEEESVFDNNNSNDIFFNRIIFPLYDLNGNVVGFSGRIYNTKDNSKYINSKESELFKKSNVLYNYHRVKEHLKKKDSVIIMEGFLDVIRASTIGVDNCVATMGTAFTKQHASLIKQLTFYNLFTTFSPLQNGYGSIK